jgi:hypothetical protein
MRPGCEGEPDLVKFANRAHRCSPFDEAHGQRPCNLAMLVAHEDRAELQALQARHRGLDRVDVAVRQEQIVGPGPGPGHFARTASH